MSYMVAVTRKGLVIDRAENLTHKPAVRSATAFADSDELADKFYVRASCAGENEKVSNRRGLDRSWSKADDARIDLSYSARAYAAADRLQTLVNVTLIVSFSAFFVLYFV